MYDHVIEPDVYVRLKTDPERSGIVQPGERTTAGRRMVPVRLGNGRVSWLPADALEPVPTAPPELADRFAEGRFVAPDWLRRTLTRIRVAGRLSDVVYSMEATETDFYAYQFKPVLKLLDSPTDALLIADEVGLGKTIEAGLIWTELRARLECNRLLVVCPKTLCEKWRAELDQRFGVDARIVGATEFRQLMSKPGNSGRGFAAIASMQGLRPPRGWDDEEVTDGDRRQDDRLGLAQLLRDAAENEPLIDLLMVDEAHHMRNPDTLLHGLGALLNAVSAHRIFLSATPIHLRNRDLHSLLRLIDPGTFEHQSTLDELISVNEPIIAARDMLMRPGSSRAEIIERINAALEFDLLADSKSLRLLRDDLDDLEECSLDEPTRAELASRLERVNQMANFMVRTRRRDVEEFRIVREPTAPLLEMHEDERAFYEKITAEVRDYAINGGVNEGFLLSQPQRLLSSSLAAASAYWTGYEENETDPVEETDDDLILDNNDDRPLVTKIAKLARALNMTERLEKVDTKFKLLLEQLGALWDSNPDTKIIVFSSFKPTLYYLKRRLTVEGVGSELLHGSVHEPRHTILERFRDSSQARVLLSSEVGSEGVDLQFCWVVVNYDLPWNPMRLEQRIGRVDRLGQPQETIKVLNLIYAHTVDAIIYQRLYQRLELTQRAIGEFEAILGEPIRDMTRKLLDPTLNDEQKKEIVEQTRIAVENRRRQEQALEQEAGALIRHGDYVLEKVSETRKHHRWLSGDDILTFVKDCLDHNFPGCAIEASPAGLDTYRIVLCPNAREEFMSFIARKHLRGTTQLVAGNDGIRYRFGPSVARARNGRVENISQVHTLVRFAVELDEHHDETRFNQSVAASIHQDQFAIDCELGTYAIGIRRWLAKTAGNRINSIALIAYAGTRLEGAGLLPVEDAEAMVAAAAEHGRTIVNFVHDERFSVAKTRFRTVVVPELDRSYEAFVKRAKADIEDRATIQKRALHRHSEVKRNTLNEQRDNHERESENCKRSGDNRGAQRRLALARATEGRLRKLENNVELRLSQIEQQRQFTPEWSDIASLVIEVRE